MRVVYVFSERWPDVDAFMTRLNNHTRRSSMNVIACTKVDVLAGSKARGSTVVVAAKIFDGAINHDLDEACAKAGLVRDDAWLDGPVLGEML